jgi:hypothetical protein
MRHLRLLIIVIGIFQARLSLAQEETSAEFHGKAGLVEVEPSNVITSEIEGEYKLVPYLDRRGKWGQTFSIGYSSYEPKYYEPDFITMDSSELYSTPDTPMIELRYSVKRNAGFGSIGGEFMLGIYSNSSDVDPVAYVDSTLQIIPVSAGLVISFDSFTPEPRFVPYIGGGLYTMIYKEETDTRSLNGNTQVAPYVTGGVNFQLDWIDKQAARKAYEDSGIQASYLYVELSKYLESSAAQDKDFSNDYNWGVGIRVEL